MATRLDLENLGPTVSEAVGKARHGEEVTIAERGQPVARIVAADGPPAARAPEFGALKGLMELAEDFNALLPEAELQEWEK